MTRRRSHRRPLNVSRVMETLEVRSLMSAAVGVEPYVEHVEPHAHQHEGEAHTDACTNDVHRTPIADQFQANRANPPHFGDDLPALLGGAPNLHMINASLVTSNGTALNSVAVGQAYVFMKVDFQTTDLPAGETYNVRTTIGGTTFTNTLNWGAGVAGTSNWSFVWGNFVMPGGTPIASAEVDDNAGGGSGSVVESNELDNVDSFFVNGQLPAFQMVTPLEGTPHVNWSIGNYVDLDVDSDIRDYRGGTFAYDGHNGWDIGPGTWKAGDTGIDIRAAAAGTVIDLDDGHFDRNTVGNGQPSNYVVIDHGGGFTTVYHHMRRDSIVVADNQVVAAGQKIGLMGSSGNSSGLHLHFAVYYNGQQVEPNVAPSSYFINPIGYSADNPTVLASGITNYDPTGPTWSELAEGATTADTLLPGETATYWVSPAGVNAGETFDMVWYRPNGTAYTSYNWAAPQMQGGYWLAGLTLPANAPLGDWEVAFKINGVEESRDVFHVNTTGAPQARMYKSNFLSSSYVVDGRTTPYDFGTVKQYQVTLPTQTFGVKNSGQLNLTTTTPNLPAGFTQTTALAANIAAGASDAYTLRLDNTTLGHKIGSVSFVTNDFGPGELIMSYRVEGTVEALSPLKTGDEIDEVYIRRDGINTEIFVNTDPGLTPTYVVPINQMADFVLNTGLGNDHLTVDFSAGNPLAAGGMTFHGGTGDDTLTVIGDGNANTFNYLTNLINFGTSPVDFTGTENIELVGGGGNDSFGLGNGDVDTNVLTDVIVNGGAGTDTITLFDQSDTGNDGYEVTHNSFDKSSWAGSLGWNTTEALVLNGNGGNNNFFVESNISTTLNGNGGNDVFGISSTAKTLFNIGSGDVVVNGGADTDQLNIFDENFNGPANFTVTPNTVILPFNGAETPYSNLEILHIAAGNGANLINVSGTNAATGVKISTTGGVDNINVTGTAPGSEVIILTGDGDDNLNVNTDNVATAGVLLTTSETLGSMILGAGGHVRVLEDGDFVLRTQSLSVNNAAYIDLADNHMMLDYTGATVLPAVQGLLTSGYAGGTWNGNGIRSSAAAVAPKTALGYAEATDLFGAFPATFAGQGVDNTAILIRHTLGGDVNLNRTVDIGDFAAVAANFNVAPTPWARGNFNYDAGTDIGDFSILASNFNQVLAGDLPRASTAGRSLFAEKAIDDVWNLDEQLSSIIA